MPRLVRLFGPVYVRDIKVHDCTLATVARLAHLNNSVLGSSNIQGCLLQVKGGDSLKGIPNSINLSMEKDGVRINTKLCLERVGLKLVYTNRNQLTANINRGGMAILLELGGVVCNNAKLDEALIVASHIW